MAAVVLLGSSALAYVYFKLNGNIHHVDLNFGNRPAQAKDGKPINVLLMGSDTRTGSNIRLGGGPRNSGTYGNSDTMMIMHITADHQHAYVMSMPRDLVIDMPVCTGKNGAKYGGTRELINAIYSLCGPVEVVKFVESLTHIFINHVMVIDFQGFANMVNDIGGVKVCVPQTVDDSAHGIVEKKGVYTVMGQQALNYVRERYDLGNGGDLSRETRQHAFLSSMIKKIESDGVLVNPDTLYHLANDATSALTVDDGLDSVTKLLSFANEVKGIKPANVKFFTVANEDYAETELPDYSYWSEHLEFLQPEANEEFAALAKDTMNPATGRPSASPSKPVGTGISVRIYNGTSTSSLGQQTKRALIAKGFTVGKLAPARSSSIPSTIIQYGPRDKADAQTLLKLYPGAEMQKVSGNQINLVLGASTQLPGASSSTKVPTVISTARPATANICSGLNNGDD